MQFFVGRQPCNGCNSMTMEYRDVLTGFQNTCCMKGWISWLYPMFSPCSLLAFHLMFVLYILICLKFIDLIYYLFSISPLYLCSLPSSHFRVFVSLAAILNSYLHLLLFRSIIPSFLFTGPSHPFLPLLSCLSPFLIAPWMSTASYGYCFLFSPLAFLFVSSPIPLPFHQ